MDQKVDYTGVAISPEELAAVVASDAEYKSAEWRGIKIIIRPFISFAETVEFVNSVMQSCFSDEGNLFVPEMMELSFRGNIVLRYTNVSLPKDIEDQYKILIGTDLVDVITENVSRAQLSSIREVISSFLWANNNKTA